MSLMHSRSFNDVRDQLDRMFREMDEIELPSFFRAPWRTTGQVSSRAWVPAVELSETEKEYLIKAEIPGIKPENIDVEVLGNQVVIRGETREEHEEEQRNIYRSELRYGSFERRIQLPEEIDADKAKADFDHGVLKLRFPKPEEKHTKRKKIQIK